MNFTNISVKNKFMKRLMVVSLLAFSVLASTNLTGQCGFDTGEGCVGTDYSNAFSTSTTNRNTIEYDNFISGFHSTIVRTSTGGFKAWGEYMNNNGSTNALSPLDVTSANYSALTGTPLKATLGSNFFQAVQGILLTTTGLFAWGSEGIVLSGTITSSTTFQKLTINGEADGLPVGVDPTDVKMITASYRTLAIVTCSGSVYVLAQDAAVRGVNGGGSATAWSQVTTTASGNPTISGIVACRVSYNTAFALGSDGSLYTWGTQTYLGEGSAIASRTRATPMSLPAFNSGASVKMISITAPGNTPAPSYYVLSTDNNLYAVGENSSRQLGDWSTTDRLSWVQPRYSSGGQVLNDIKWIAANENDAGGSTFGAINVLTTGAQIYNWGQNGNSMLGRGTDPANPGTPTGIAPTDEMIALESGGHTSMYVKKCEVNFGYVGHRINGSMGNGDPGTAVETSVTYATANVAICAADAIPKITLSITPSGSGGSYCTTQTATVSASPAGGTLSVFSGPATLSGNDLTFSGAGQVILAYTISPPCGGVSDVKDTLDVIVCVSAVTESGTVLSSTGGTAINNVASNDLINGSPATLGGGGNATIAESGTWPSGITLNTSTGEVSVIPGTTPGTYPVTYQICDKLTPANCVNMEDTVFVLPSTYTLTIDKSQVGGPNPITAAGQVINYQIVVTNTGDATQTGVNVSDVLPGGGAGTLSGPTESVSSNGNLNVGETWTYTISYTATQADIDAGVNLVNTASVTTTQVPGPTTDTATTPVSQTPSLTIAKDQTGGPNPITAAGQTINYTIVVTNTGNQTQTGVNVSDVLPGGGAGTLSGPSESVSSNGNLNVGETWTYTISYTATQADIDAGANLVNTASVTTTQVPGPTTDTATTPVTQSPSLTITKDQTGGPNPITSAGQTINYTIVVTNTGNQTQTGVNVSDVLPGGGAGTLSGPTESVSSNGNLNVGETWTYTISYTATQADIDAGANLVNSASVTTTQVPGPTTDTATTPVTQSPSLTIAKDQTGGPNPITAAGQTINYTIVVTNTGNQTQTGVNVSDVLPGGGSGTLTGPVESVSSNGNLNVGETWTYTISYTATQADIDAGANLVNTASVTTTQVPGPTTDTATTPVTQSPSLTIAKDQTGGPNPITASGQVIGYTIIVTNTGSQTLTGVNIGDVLPDGNVGILSGPVESLSTNGQLNVGETWTYTTNYTTSQNDIDLGDPLVNVVTVTTNEAPTPVSDDASTDVSQSPSLTIAKDQTGGPNPITAAGQTIDYTIVVTNTGNQTQTGVNVSDVLPGGGAGTLSGPTESVSSNGNLNVGETWTYTISYTATQADIDAGANLINTASVTTTQVPGPTTDTATTPVTQSPSLTITKDQTGGPNPITAAGQTIDYTIVVTNTGNQTQTGVNVSDVLPGGGAGTLSGPTESVSSNGNLNIGETWTYTISYTATQADIDAGANLVNTASVTTTQVPGPTTDTATTPVTQSPSLTIAKDQTSGPNPITAAGQTIDYTIVVTNTGNQTQTGVNVSDVLPGGGAGSLTGPVESVSSNGNLNVGETWTYTISYTATQADIDAGANLVNTASVTTTQVPGPTTDTATTPVTQSPSLTIAKDQTSGPNPITAAGQTINYTIVVTNTGNQTQTGVNVSDVLPGGGAGTLTGPVESVSSNGNLNVGETWTYTISYTATQADIDAGANLVNSASVTTTQVPGPTTDTATTPVTQSPSLTIAKDQTGGPNPITAAGQTINYTIVVTNTGNQTQTGVNVSDVLPGGGAGTLSGPTESVSSNGSLNVGETWTYTISYTATQADIDAGANLVNSASVTTTQVPGPTTDTATTPVTQSPSLTITKDQTSGPNPITAAGQTIDYTIVVTNTGNQTQTGVNVSDVLPGGGAGTLSGPTESVSSNGNLNVGETWTYTISYTATQADIDAGANLVNSASVTTTQVPGPTTDTATTPVTQSPSLTIAKDQTGGPNPITAAGQTIDYNIVVTNTGNQTQTGVNVSDVLPGGGAGTLSGPTESVSSNGNLNIGETWTYTISYTATQADIDAGANLVNTASVTTTQVPGPTTDTATTPVTQSPSLTIAKDQTGGPNPITAAGQTINYTIVVTNTGNQTQTGVNVSDVLPGGGIGSLTGPVESVSSNGNLNIGETWTYTISYTATQADIDAGANLVNTASVTTTQVPGPTTDTAITPVSQTPSLTITKDQTGGPNPITAAGQTIDYTIVVTNTGNQTQTGVNVSDVLPGGGAGTLSGPTESVSSNGNLNIGETWTYTISYTATQADIDAGANLVNTASVTTTQVPGPTTDTATTPVSQTPSLTIAKTQITGPNPVTTAGQVIGYSIVVFNNGNQTQTGVNVTDILPDGGIGSLTGPVESVSSNGNLNIGETWTYTISYTATQADIDAGANLVNTASVTTTQVPGPTTDTATTPVSQTPALTITKDQTGGPNPITAAGQTINYTIVVTNTGNQTQTGVNVSDVLPGGGAGTLSGPTESVSSNGNLNVGETWTYTISYTATQADIDAGANLVNTASVTTTQVPGPTTDTATTPVTQSPSLTIAKDQTGGPNPITAAGQTINYTIVVTNTGNQTQTGVNVSDVLPGGGAGTLSGPTESVSSNGNLNIGETWTYTISYTATQADIDAGANLVNTASVTTTQVPGPTTDTATTQVTQSPSLTIAKDQTSGPNPITAAGQTINYTIVVTNTGNQTQTGVNVSDVLPGGGAGTLSGPTESVSSNGNLNVGETWTYTISYTTTQADIDAGANLVNTASVTTTQVPGPTTDTATTPVTQSPSLTIAKDQTSGPNPITAAGQTINYTIVVTNTGNQTQTGVNVSDVLPGGGAGTLSGPTESVSSNGNLNIGETWTYTISYTATQADIDAGANLVNTASVTTTQVPGPTTDTATTPVSQTPSLTITKDQTGGPNPITAAGQTIDYTIVVTNTGNQTQTGVNVSDVLPGGGAGTLSGPTESVSSNGNLNIGETWTYTISYTATQADIDAGANLINTASVTTTQVPGPTTDTATTPVTQSPSLTIAKDQTGGPNPITAAGQTINYTIVVTNTGNQTQTGVNVSDVLPGGGAGTLSGPTESVSSNGNLNVGETWTYTISYTATQADIDAGANLVNTASVTTTQVPGPTTTQLPHQLARLRH